MTDVGHALAAVLRSAYGIDAVVTPIGSGLDSAATVYRVDPGFVLKVRRGRVYEPGVTAPTRLVAEGMKGLVAPVPALDGRLWVDVDGLALVLYPFVDGHPGKTIGLTENQWTEFGSMVRRLHDGPLLDGLPGETYRPKWSGAWRTWDEARALIPVLPERRDEVRELIDTAERLAEQLRRRDLPLVLCHADLHTNNVLVDPAGELWLIDWDEVMLAPRERDLMFAVGGGISRQLLPAEAEGWFAAGYGDTELDPLALTYYRHAWAIQDVSEFGVDAAAGVEDSAHLFDDLFLPGRIVDNARRSATR